MIHRFQEKILEWIGRDYAGYSFLENYLCIFILAFFRYIVTPEKVYLRGQEIEQKVFAKSNDMDIAWIAASNYYYDAGDRGSKEANLRLARHWEESKWYSIAAAYYWRIARMGNLNGCHSYVCCYAKVLSGCSEENISPHHWNILSRRSIFCCRKLYRKGDKSVSMIMAIAYLTGNGVKQNTKKALYYYNDACEYILRDGGQMSNRIKGLFADLLDTNHNK